MSDAIVHIGFTEVKNLVMALSVIDLFSKTEPVKNFSLVNFWKHSIAVGIIALLMGKELGAKKIENYYISGVLHDIGNIFFLRAFNSEYKQVLETALSEGKNLSEIESRKFGMNHLEAGELIAEKWKIPLNIRNSISHHHDGMVDGAYDLQVATIYLSDKIATILELGDTARFKMSRPDPGVWDFLKMEPGILEELYPSIMKNYGQAISILLLSK